MTTPEDLCLEFFDQWDFLGPSPPNCSALYRNGNPCRCRALVRLPEGPRCMGHTPKAIQDVLTVRRGQRGREEEAEFDRWASTVEARIVHLYELAAPYRRIPPPESIACALLEELQETRCLVCWRKQEVVGSLIEDHDHDTGMTRALLCRSCNIVEGAAGRRPWPVYRQFAPATGWFCRYFGMGGQWRWDYDPLPNRIKMDVRPSDLIDPGAVLDRYRSLIRNAPDTEIPKSCRRRFDGSGHPLLMQGERYATWEERPRYADWPIIDDPSRTATDEELGRQRKDEERAAARRVPLIPR